MKHYPDVQPFGGRRSSLLRMVPDLFEKKRSVLYVGARDGRMDFGRDLMEAGASLVVLEIHRPNVEYLDTVPGLSAVIHGDVRTAELDSSFDLVFWWHGPEHVRIDELSGTLMRLESITNELVVLGCPWGRYEQRAEYGNPHEVHLSHLAHRTLEELGYEVECLGKEGTPGSNLTAVKRMA